MYACRRKDTQDVCNLFHTCSRMYVYMSYMMYVPDMIARVRYRSCARVVSAKTCITSAPLSLSLSLSVYIYIYI